MLRATGHARMVNTLCEHATRVSRGARKAILVYTSNRVKQAEQSKMFYWHASGTARCAHEAKCYDFTLTGTVLICFTLWPISKNFRYIF